MEPLIRPQTVNYTTTSVQSDPEPSYLVPDDAPTMQPEAEPQPDPMMQRGFVPVESGVLYEEHIPVGEPYAQPAAEPARKTRRQICVRLTDDFIRIIKGGSCRNDPNGLRFFVPLNAAI